MTGSVSATNVQMENV